MNFFILQTLLILSLVAYFVFDAFEDRRVQDEREELIRLKTHRFVQKVSSWSLCTLTLLYVYDRNQPAIVFLVAMVLASLYSEIAGRIFWRSRL
ncbi:MAG: hypothetical protein ABIR96_06980 [Bdellovibrionota bacterium]